MRIDLILFLAGFKDTKGIIYIIRCKVAMENSIATPTSSEKQAATCDSNLNLHLF